MKDFYSRMNIYHFIYRPVFNSILTQLNIKRQQIRLAMDSIICEYEDKAGNGRREIRIG